MSNFLPFAQPDIGDEEIAEVVAALKSGWITTGPRTRQFEQDFAEFMGDGLEAVAVNSATAGLHLALEAAGLGPGDQVITTPYTFTATAEVIRYLGADPVFVDIDPNTFNIDPVRIDDYLTKNLELRTKNSARVAGLVPVHFAGLPCNMDKLLAISKRHGFKVIEDAAHALPARHNGEVIGTLGSAATVFSFYATKTITTGEGGMLVTRDPELARRCRIMRLHGISSDAFDRYTASKPKWFYEVLAPGFKYNMTDLAAALGIHQLKKAWQFQKRRTEMAARYDEAFKNLPILLPPKAPAGDLHSWHLYVIRLAEDARVRRDEFIERMYEQGIGCSVHFIPLHLHPYWRDRYDLKPDDFPNALKVYKQAVSLPIYTKMSDNDQQRVIEAVKTVLS